MDGLVRKTGSVTDDYEEALVDHRRLVRELDILLNGEANAARQASLCDIVSQVRREGIRVGGALMNEPHADAARLDWLQKHADEAVFDGPTEADKRYKINTGKGTVCGATFRDAIDNARGVMVGALVGEWNGSCVLGHCGWPSGCERDDCCRADPTFGRDRA